MPITKSAKKALKVSARRRLENLRLKDKLSRAVKKAGKGTLSPAFSAIDKAVKGGVIHTNKAARLKSRLTKAYGSPEARATKAGKRTKPKSKKSKKG